MSYPAKPIKHDKISNGVTNGDDLPAAAPKIEAALDALFQAMNDTISFVRLFSNPDGTLKTDIRWQHLESPTAQDEVGDGSTVTFAFQQPISPATDFVRVLIDDGTGYSILPSTNFTYDAINDDVTTDNYTYDTDEITLTVAPTATESVRFLVFYNWQGVLASLNNLSNNTVDAAAGAALVAYDDPQGLYLSDTVRDCLTEVMDVLVDYIASVGALTTILRSDGSVRLTGHWELNERSGATTPGTAATGEVRLNGNPVDGDTITISDGAISTTFEFDDDAAVSGGNVAVTIGSGGATVEDDHKTTLDNLAAAMTAALLDITTNVFKTGDSAPLTTAQMDLTNNTAGSAGNVEITLSDFAANIEVDGMDGGTDAFQALVTSHRIRNGAPSLRDGDMVVHEQIEEVRQAVDQIAQEFLRTDGSNRPTANISWDGNRLTDLGAGQDPNDAVNLTQLTEVQALLAKFVPKAGTKDTTYGSQGIITGPLSLGFDPAADTADADQAPTPVSGVVNHTIYGVPTPGADDQVTPKKYVDDQIAAAIVQSEKMYGTGELGDATGASKNPSFPTDGIYDFEALEIDVNTALPNRCIIRVQGDCTISAALTVSASSPTRQLIDPSQVRGVDGGDGSNDSGNAGGGGGGGGLTAGGTGDTIPSGITVDGAPGAASLRSDAYWKFLTAFVGGKGGGSEPQPNLGGDPGGYVLLLVGGNLVFTGGSIVADGNNGTLSVGDAGGGGAGGSIYVHCNGTLTDGTFQTDGGDGAGGGFDNGGGGAAGLIVLRARNLLGNQSIQATPGVGPGSAADGGSGTAYVVYVTKDQAVAYAPGSIVTDEIVLTTSQFDLLATPAVE